MHIVDTGKLTAFTYHGQLLASNEDTVPHLAARMHNQLMHIDSLIDTECKFYFGFDKFVAYKTYISLILSLVRLKPH